LAFLLAFLLAGGALISRHVSLFAKLLTKLAMLWWPIS
jgi:hypothetical protein